MTSRTDQYLRGIGAPFYDFFASGLAFFVALNYSINQQLSIQHSLELRENLVGTAVFAIIASGFILSSEMRRSIWRYSSLSDFLTVLRVSTLTGLLFLPIVFLATRAEDLPRSTPVIAWVLMVGLLSLPRLICRLWADSNAFRNILRSSNGRLRQDAVPILIAGDMNRIEPFVRELRRQNAAPYQAVGIFTEQLHHKGRVIHGVPIFGSIESLEEAITFLRTRGMEPRRLVVADDGRTDELISNLLEHATRHGLTLGRLPRLLDLEGKIDATTVKPVAIADLLGRPQIVLDKEPVKNLIAGRRVLITGAGGSVGSELVRQISDLGPAWLGLLEGSEFNLYSIDKEVAQRHPRLKRTEILCDVRDRQSLNRWFQAEKPEIVFHAAALKHVPLVEAHALEGIRTNVLGTQNVADLCLQHDVRTMVLVSTDKAVNPHNVMGATKRCAEAYCQAMDAQAATTRFVAVRFGNVLGSAGSVVPLFQKQLQQGGPITVTHPDMTRYFMTIPEAVSLMLQASGSAAGTQECRGGVYVLDMGKPVKILDLAKQMIRLSGKRPDIDIKIEIVGIRPGEKLYEELTHADEKLANSPTPGVMVATPRTSALPILRAQLLEVARAVEHLDEERSLRLLHLLVPEFEQPAAWHSAGMGSA